MAPLTPSQTPATQLPRIHYSPVLLPFHHGRAVLNAASPEGRAPSCNDYPQHARLHASRSAATFSPCMSTDLARCDLAIRQKNQRQVDDTDALLRSYDLRLLHAHRSGTAN